jgi:hypothetical protein
VRAAVLLSTCSRIFPFIIIVVCVFSFFLLFSVITIASPFRVEEGSTTKAFFHRWFYFFFSVAVYEIVFVAHLQSFQLYSRVIKANNDAWDAKWMGFDCFAISPSFFRSLSCDERQR